MKKRDNEDNEWDDKRIPRIKLAAEQIKYRTKVRMNNTQQVINNMMRHPKEIGDLKIQLRRSQQLAYIEPWFQMFLPPNLKDKIFICSIGKKFWVIGAINASYATRFNFAKREIRTSLEAHLNRISKKKWSLPEFKVSIFPEQINEDNRYLEEIIKMKEIISLPFQKSAPRSKEHNKQRLENILKKIDERIKSSS